MSSSQLDKVTGRVHRMEKRLTMEKDPPHDRLSVTDLRVDGFQELVNACRADQRDNHRVLLTLENTTGQVDRKLTTVDESVGHLRTDGAAMYEDITDILTTEKDVQKKQDRLLGDVGTLKEHVGTLKEHVGTLKEDVRTLKDLQAGMASDIKLFKRGQSDMRADLALLKRNLSARESDILFLRTGQDRLKGDVELLKNDVDLLKEDVNVLKTDVTVVKEDVHILKTGQDEILSLLKRVVAKVDPNDD